MAINFNIENNSVDGKSFALIRTNPKLASNIKLIVDSFGEIFLGSFKSNRTLSQVMYQRYAIDANGSYSNDIAKFCKGLSNSDKYYIWRKFSDITTYSDYEYQYEDQYNAGASFNTTKLYDEQYKIFAPIWLDRKVPNKFVIYRVENVDYSVDYPDNEAGQNARILELLNKAVIVKSFDLTEKSKLGKYLHNHVFDKSVPVSPIHFNFGEDAPVEFKGIDTLKGGFATKKEFLSKDYIQRDLPEIFANELISGGFERHGIVSANLINMEFLFDDPLATNYNIYRYFGVYVDEHTEGEFEINHISTDGIVSIDPNTVSVNYNLSETGLDPINMIPSHSELNYPVLSYLKNGNNYYHIANQVGQLPTSKFKINFSEFPIFNKFTATNNLIQTTGKTPNSRGFVKLTLKGVPAPGDKFFVGDKTEIESSNYNMYEYTCVADSSLNPGVAVGNKYSNQGSLHQIAYAISKVIKLYKVYVYGNSIVIEDYTQGSSRKRMAVGILDNNLTDFFTVEVGNLNDIGLIDSVVPVGVPTTFSDWNIFTAAGGSKEGASFLVDETELGDVKVGEYVKSFGLNKFTRIIDVVKDHFDSTKYRVIIKDPIKISNDNTIQPYISTTPTFGKFSAYAIKDFDFDFYSTFNSNLGELEYDKELLDAEYQIDWKTLTPVLEAEKIEDDIEPIQINSEYDRLHENALKETALNSRIVPTIMKFALKNGTNARNNPYILNVNESFGEDNLSPNIVQEAGRDHKNFNMEHFYINSIPKIFYDQTTVDDNYMTGLTSYLDFNSLTGGVDGISEEKLKSVDIDYFSLYFKWNGAWNYENETWYDDKLKNMFTTFGSGTIELEPSTVFRGLRYIYKKRKEFLKQAPTEFIKTPEVNDYKFGVVLNYITSDTNSIAYKVIKNDVFKFICVYINLSIIPNSITEIGLTRTLLYTLNDIDLNGEILNTEIPFNLDLSLTNWNDPIIDAQGQESYLISASPFEILNNTARFTEHITKQSNDDYSWIFFDASGDQYAMQVVSVISDTEITVRKPIAFNGGPSYPLSGGEPLYGSAPAEDAVLNSVVANTNFYYWRGGEAGWKNILEEIVSYKFAKRFNEFGNIEYITVTESGELFDQYVLEVQDGVEFIKPSILTTESDGDRPKSYKLTAGEIGKVITSRNDGYFTLLRRMNGDYTPLFRDVVTFTNIYNEQSIYIPEVGDTTIEPDDIRKNLIFSKFRNLGIAFSSFKGVDPKYGYIQNMFFHKVNDENSRNLLKLSDTSDKLPLYPLIGEIAIDKRDINVFNSKYSNDYFTKSVPNGGSEPAHGTLSPVEIKSFMASTIMKVKDVYDLTRFTVTQESSIDTLDAIRFNKLDRTGIHWLDTDSQIIADFYLPKAILDELKEDKIAQSFSKYILKEFSYADKTTLDDDLEKYVYSNIVNRFIIDSVDVYAIFGKNIESNFVSVEDPKELLDNGFVLQTNFDIQGYQNDALSFRLIYNKRVGYGYALKVHVKIQA